MMKKISCIVLLMSMWVGTMFGTTAAKGIFTVGASKIVQFADANEASLVQWSTAYDWREDNKNADGHNGWFVLDHEEWSKLLSPIDGSRTNAENLNNLGTVDGDSGLIILPDGWVQPAGIPAFKTVDKGIFYDKNIYTADEWAVMEKSGAVFLPCQGYRDGEGLKNATDHGAYWSSDEYSAAKGYCVRFNNGDIHDQNYQDKDLYYSLRLVKEVTATELDEEDNLATFTTKLGTADDYRFAIANRSLKKDGTFYTLCLPFDVPNIDASPLAGAEVFEFAGGSVTGGTGNEVLHLALTPLDGKRLTQGVPYILRWNNTGETMTKLYFYDVENWDDNTSTATDPGNATVKFHGVYPKAHIPGYASGSVAHYNFFLGANNTLYWPDDTTYPEAEGHNMKGFRAYFYTSGGGPSPVSRYRNMPAVWDIGGESAPTNMERWTMDNGQWKKVLRDGQIVLVIDGKEFDLQGKQIK